MADAHIRYDAESVEHNGATQSDVAEMNEEIAEFLNSKLEEYGIEVDDSGVESVTQTTYKGNVTNA